MGLVRGFLATYLSLRAQLFAWCASQSEAISVGTMAEFLALVWSDAIPRASVNDDVEYVVHGRIGCLLRSTEGVEVDVDVRGAEETFDLWRLRRFGRSLPAPVDVPDTKLEDACRRLAEQGELMVVGDGWFSVPPTR